MNMYFSRAVLREDADAISLGQLGVRDGYSTHKLVWRLFPSAPDQPRDFLFREETISRRPGFYLVSSRPPEDTQALWAIESKSYQPRLRVGQRLSFLLRANPVRSHREAAAGRLKRHDVVMDLKTRMKAASPDEPLPPLPALVQEAGFRWLSARAPKHGFQVEEDAVRVEGYRQHRLIKGRQKMPIRLSTLDFAGVLTVSDPDLLVQTLYRGIGPAKGFGCGLLMVKRL